MPLPNNPGFFSITVLVRLKKTVKGSTNTCHITLLDLTSFTIPILCFRNEKNLESFFLYTD